MRELAEKRVVVIGLGASGCAAARLCLARGAKVVANDSAPLAQLSADAHALGPAGAELVAGGHAEAQLAAANLIVVSPGVPPFAALRDAERGGVPVISELELATSALRHSAPIVAIGGTNGKSTTTELVGALLATHGLATFLGGNLGEPLSDHADERFDVVVLEVSSFQLERVETFCPRVSALLNVTPDHLDRYANFDEYARAKGNAFARQGPGDLAVGLHDDDRVLGQCRRGRGVLRTFGPGGDVDVTAEAIVDRCRGERYARAEIALSGGHNALNVAAALAATDPFAIPRSTAARVFAEFRGLAHRTALVAEVFGARYYDDSKGTNVGASVTALLGLLEPRCVLIAGGRDKGGSYAPLAAALREKGRAAVLIGESARAIAEAVGDAVPVSFAKTMEDAVALARRHAQRGDAVLLSPACSSFDMFRDYKHRGDEFVRCVHALGEERET